MKVINVTPGLIAIPPNGWGAVEKIIWDYHLSLENIGVNNEILYLNDIKYDDSMIVHVHVANLANMCHERGIPYIFTIHDHHAYLYGKDSDLFKQNLQAIENSVISLSPCKYLIPYFGSKKLRYFSHAVNTSVFKCNERVRHKKLKLLCVANNGYAYNQSVDRKGFGLAIQAAMNLDMQITIAGPSNNNNFFKTLDPKLNNYSNLTKLYDLDEKWLVHLYNEHDAFVHLSELEAGHPNLTLLEAMACGLPVIGTFEESSYKGMAVCKRDITEAEAAISLVDQNYDQFRKDALENAAENSYDSRVYDLVKIYSEYRETIFANRIINHYINCEKTHKEVKNNIKIWFPSGPKVEILGPVSKKYKIKFTDTDVNTVTYETTITNNMWSSSIPRYFRNWVVEVYEMNDNEEILVESHTFDLKNKKVKLIFDTNSMGDILAYIGSAEKFRQIHGCDLTCVVYNDQFLEIFSKNYKDIKFSRTNDSDDNYYAAYSIGYFDQNNWNGNIPVDPKKTSLALIAPNILGLPLVEYKPKLEIVPVKHDKKYVCIATQSTAQAKYWNNPDGWKEVINYLNKKGYEVWCIDRHSSYGGKDKMNYIPEGAIDKTGDLHLEERLSQIKGAEFFIGLGSGLSWLSWAAGQKVILISGFSEEFAEFNTDYRVINKNVCHGCWNDVSHTFDKGNWNWCPRGKDFECTKQISSGDVIKMIDKIV
jgi:autotransporter strand-loop-strand O-heptosyltransferase